MEQTKALNALEVSHQSNSHRHIRFNANNSVFLHIEQPFLALTKSATSPRAAADLVQRATSAPNTFIFTELLHAAPIAALANDPEYAPHLTHLQLFAHGLYSTYQRQATGLPPLNPAQQLKLRQLSLVTLSRDKNQLTYPNLMTQLGLGSTRELEDVVISAVYAGLLTAKLNPIRQEVQVSSVAPLRDVPPVTVSALVSTLQRWSARCDATLAELEDTVSRIRADAARAAERRRENDLLVQGAIEAAAAQKESADTNSGTGGQGTGRRLRTSNNQRGSNARQHMGAGTSGGGGGNQAGASGAKRGSEKLMESMAGAEEDDEAMDLDDDGDGTAGQKRASRRKL